MDNELIESEAACVRAGLNPMFGRYERTFNFAPVSYASPASVREAFVQQVRAAMGVRYVFSGFVQLSILLHLETQLVRESDRYGDLDNYAKSIGDALKGREGILIDDCQVQDLHISWVDAVTPSFDIRIEGIEEAYVYKEGLCLYEMPDDLYYPQSSLAWARGGPEQLQEIDILCGLLAFAHAARSKKAFRHLMRQGGATPREGFQNGQLLALLQIGFHTSRAAASGFEMVPYRVWQARWEALKGDPELGARARDLDAIFDRLRNENPLMSLSRPDIQDLLKRRRSAVLDTSTIDVDG